MRVSAFIDRSTISSHFSVNSIYRLPAYKAPLKPQSSYKLEFNRSLYLVGGRASIAEFCKDNPFRITSTQGDRVAMEMARGVPGLTEEERKDLGIEKEAFLSTAMGIFKKKMITLIQIRYVGVPNADQLMMPKASSTCLPELIALHEATAVQVIMSSMSHDTEVLKGAVGTRHAHNDKFR